MKIINSKSEIRNTKQIQMTKPRRANHKLQTTNYKQISKDNEQKNKQKTFVKIRVIRGPVFVLNFELLNFGFVSNFVLRASDLFFFSLSSP